MKYIIFLISLFSFNSLNVLFIEKIMSIFNIVPNSEISIILVKNNFPIVDDMILRNLCNFVKIKYLWDDSIFLFNDIETWYLNKDI